MRRKNPLESFTGRKLKQFEKDSDVAQTIQMASKIVQDIDVSEKDEPEKDQIEPEEIKPVEPEKFEKQNLNDHKTILEMIKKKVKDEEKFKVKNKTPQKTNQQETSLEDEEWQKAKELFPKHSFPWHVLPVGIAESLQQLSRSCATSPTSLPGAAFSIFASVIGSTVHVSPKKSWEEPMIFWCGDIRPSGSGKTPAARELCRVLYKFQKLADEDYKKSKDEWQSKSSKERGDPPERARGYFVTDLTLEGLRAEVTEHGGIVCVMDELSSFLSAQNQYKSKGNDRECWLSLWDGKTARIVRANESFTIYGSRVNIFGGIQPRVWQDFFGGEKGFFLEDGTIYRFLTIYENDSFFPLTSEAWNDENRDVWEQALINAIEWADYITSQKDWKPKALMLNEEAQNLFLDWRNELFAEKIMLPKSLRGFLPKIVSYSLRFSGLLHMMESFSSGLYPDYQLTPDDLLKGIEVATFYIGHAVDALQALCSDEALISFEVTEQIKLLSATLESLKDKLDSGKLAIGFICENYNEKVKPDEKINPKAIGAMLRNCGLTILPGHSRANGKVGVKCMKWDKKTEIFLKKCQTNSQK